MGNKTERKRATENKGIISEEFFFAVHFSRTLSVKKRIIDERTSCKAMCIIIMKVFKRDPRTKSEIQIMLS